MQKFNLLTRRAFLDRSYKIGLGVALSTLVDIPFVMKRALAEGSIGLNGKKLLFIFLRGANDALNSVIPILDSAYNTTNRPTLLIPADAGTNYASATGTADYPVSAPDPASSNYAAFHYGSAIRAGNGFAALHPSMKFMVPVFNASQMAMVHRVGYPKQSRSHFDSQNYWESGAPNNNVIRDGIFYRTLVESGLAASQALTGVSIQSALPLILQGNAAAMTNLSDPLRYSLLGIPDTKAGKAKANAALEAATLYPFPAKKNRELLSLQYQNLSDTLSIFAQVNFTEDGNTFTDDENTDGDTAPYYLFPTSAAKNGGYALHGNDSAKYVVDNASSAYAFFKNLKAAALVLNKTDAIIAGTELGGFDTHSSQGGVTGTHANLLRRVSWAMYALRKYFLKYGKGGPAGDTTAKASWNDVIVVTLTEFGRTTVQNGNAGTDHAEAGVMFLAGGGVSGGLHGCHPTGYPGGPSNPLNWATGQTGSMFGVNNRYLKRIVDYRSVLGELIRDHLGATQSQLNRIIPGYANAGEQLLAGGTSSVDGTPILGEVGVL